jgi:hypothetical protein
MQLRFNLAGGEGNLVSHIGLLPVWAAGLAARQPNQ